MSFASSFSSSLPVLSLFARAARVPAVAHVSRAKCACRSVSGAENAGWTLQMGGARRTLTTQSEALEKHSSRRGANPISSNMADRPVYPVPDNLGDKSPYVIVDGLPPTALEADVTRLAGPAQRRIQSQLSSVTFLRDITLRPKGRAVLKFISRHGAEEFVKNAHGTFIGGTRIIADTLFVARVPSRIRGPQGPRERELSPYLDLIASERGLVVLVSGLPSMLREDALKKRLGKEFRLARDLKERGSVLKVPRGVGTTTSHFLVRLTSVSDAHRLVRRWHETFWTAEKGRKFAISATVVQ